MDDNSNESFLKAIDITQDVIKRMAHNSFLIKGWTITLVVVALLLKGSQEHIFLAIIPVVTFWLLDAYFLRQERLYRKLYNELINKKSESKRNIFDMNTDEFKEKVSVKGTIFSKTLMWFYGTISVLIGMYACISSDKVITIFDNLNTLFNNATA